jgi:hypothetical protein
LQASNSSSSWVWLQQVATAVRQVLQQHYLLVVQAVVMKLQQMHQAAAVQEPSSGGRALQQCTHLAACLCAADGWQTTGWSPISRRFKAAALPLQHGWQGRRCMVHQALRMTALSKLALAVRMMQQQQQHLVLGLAVQ